VGIEVLPPDPLYAITRKSRAILPQNAFTHIGIPPGEYLQDPRQRRRALPDVLAELRAAIQSQMRRQAGAIRSQRGESLGAQVPNPVNPFGASIQIGEDGQYATGWDATSGLTIVPFVVGISIVGGPDTVVGS
jgi:hypothetical protein